MPLEIERKFLVADAGWRTCARKGIPYRQGYILTHNGATVRVRTAGDQGFVTLKGPRSGFSRTEYEYSIPRPDADEMLDTLCDPPLIEKTRHFVEHHGAIWEVDEFRGANAGLIVAEIELTDEQQAFSTPDWIGREVSDDMRYTNLQLSRNPFSTWSD